jgi:MoaA/NifB/PqqE/SkfB family radical SAM enzyme
VIAYLIDNKYLMPFCSALYNSVTVYFNQTIRPCCRFQSGVTYSAKSFLDYQKSKLLTEVKDKMENGWHAGCIFCKNQEDLGIKSLRQDFNLKLSGVPNKLEYLDFNVSNQCNLSCRMCDNVKSSKWDSYVKKNENLLKYDFFALKDLNKKNSIEKFFENVDISNLHTIKYLGGEPFIDKSDMEDLIIFLEEKAVIQNINLECFTNATFYPEKIIPFLFKFKSVKINFSVDGLDELTEYIRSGSDWKKVIFVIDTWLKLKNQKIIFSIHHTLYSLNIHQFETVKNFSIEKNLPFTSINLFTPKYLKIDVLPREYRSYLIENGLIRDQSVLKILNSVPFDELNYKKFIEYVKLTDKILGTDINKILPKLASYF